ncbi:MAG: hypothetical protein EHM79_07070 [Geobacter sp.]|nr:MAG: hypothetical protein EHM79_07070 [Geobacter sp.]
MSDSENNKGAAVIPFSQVNKSGSLALSAKVAQLRAAGIKERIEMILSDPEGKKLARSLEPQEIYWLVKELADEDVVPLIALSSPEQFCFFLDVELWNGCTYSREKAMEWVGHLLVAGEEFLVEQLYHLDFELLLLICRKELFVGGGVGDVISDDECRAEWDHTFDDMFFITFRDEKQGPLMGRLINNIYHHDHSLYLRLMQGTKNEIDSEQEELCYRFRSGRLADRGFPEWEHALEIYRSVTPEDFVRQDAKDSVIVDFDAILPVPFFAGNSLFQRAMNSANCEGLNAELYCLINSALVAEDKSFSDLDTIDSVLQRVYGYLAIALEHLSGGDEKEAVRILETEYLKRLFQLGFGIISQLRSRAERISSEGIEHATNRALIGFRRKYPRFYRGLDQDHVDGYREFKGLADFQAADALLRNLEG